MKVLAQLIALASLSYANELFLSEQQEEAVPI